MIYLACTCGANLSAPDHTLGNSVSCPRCKGVLTVPVDAIDVVIRPVSLHVPITAMVCVLVAVPLIVLAAMLTDANAVLTSAATLTVSLVALFLSLRLLRIGLNVAFGGHPREGAMAAAVGHFGLCMAFLAIVGSLLITGASIIANDNWKSRTERRR